jgi:MscS family membrane protein
MAQGGSPAVLPNGGHLLMAYSRSPLSRHRWCFLALIVCCGASATWSQEADPAETPDAPESASATPQGSGVDWEDVGLAGFPEQLLSDADFDAAIAIVDARMDQARADAEALAAQDGSEEELGPHQQRLERLDTLKLLVQRQRTLRDRMRESERAIEEQRALRTAFDRQGLDRDPPYPVSLLDQLRDEARHVQRDHEANLLLLDSLQAQMRRGETDVVQAQRDRRRARDAFEQADAGARPDAATALELAQLDEIVAAQRLAALNSQLDLARLHRAHHDARLALLDDQTRLVEQAVDFPEDVLQERLAELEDRRGQVETRLHALRLERDANERRLYETRRALREAADESTRDALADQVAARESWLESSNRGLEYLEYRLANIATQQRLWEWRYALMNHGPDAERTAQLAELRGILARVENERAIVEARLNATRGAQVDLRGRLEDQREPPADPQALRSRIEALDQLETRSADYLASLMNVQTIAERLQMQLSRHASPASWRDWLDWTWNWTVRIWGHELLVVGDRGLYAGDVIQSLLVFLAAILAVMIGRRTLLRTVLPRLIGNLERRQTLLPDVVLVLIRNTSKWFVILLAFYVAMIVSDLARGQMRDWLRALLVVGTWLQIGWWAGAVLLRVLERTRIRKEQTDPSSVSGYGLLSFFGRAAIWAVVVLSVLAYFEYPIAGIVGALGVGGIAVAFALQNILADIFNSMAIILDKPFRVGDFIIVGETLGVVERIGIKTTRIRSLSGEQIVMTNTEVLGSRIRNFKRMYERRVVFGFGVVYQTPPEKLAQIPPMIKTIITGLSQTRFDRAHFAKYGDFSLDFEVVYYVLGPDYGLYMDIQQTINLEIYRQFQTAGIEFAYPTREIIVTRKRLASSDPSVRTTSTDP